jgi:hypothetical protein
MSIWTWLFPKRYKSGDIITDRKHFPKCVRRFDCLKGISIGHCIAGRAMSEKANAHAHHYQDTSTYGYVCVDEWRTDVAFALTMLHEVAHLIHRAEGNNMNEPDHGRHWREILSSIGGRYRPYQLPDNRDTLDFSFIYTWDDEEAFMRKHAAMWEEFNQQKVKA